MIEYVNVWGVIWKLYPYYCFSFYLVYMDGVLLCSFQSSLLWNALLEFKTLMKEQNANSMIRSWSFVSREKEYKEERHSMTNSQILIYQTPDGQTKIETRLEDGRFCIFYQHKNMLQ